MRRVRRRWRTAVLAVTTASLGAGLGLPGQPGPAEAADVPPGRILTPDGDESGYARMALPYNRDPRSRVTGALVKDDDFADGEGARCSASVIRSRTRDLLVTATHCAEDFGDKDSGNADEKAIAEAIEKGKDYTGPTGWSFVPAYNKWADSPAPYGRWKVTGIYSLGPSGEADSIEDTSKDITVLRVASSPTGEADKGRHKKIEDRTGYFTPLLNRAGRYRFTNLGYPADEPYSGHEMFRCDGRTHPATDDDGKDDGARVLETRNCATTGGNSGGPWVEHYREYSLIGVLSGGSDPSDSDPDSHAPPLAPETFGRLLARADPKGTSLGHYDNLGFVQKKQDKPGKPTEVKRGKSMTQTATVRMGGKLAHADVPITFELSKGQTFLSAEGASCRAGGRTVHCLLRDIHPGSRQHRPIDLRTKVSEDAPDRLTTTAKLTSSQLDQNKEDNTVTLEAVAVKQPK
ncbi:trypsin-like serine peptidase [Streptomyces winkii]|uniref:trypsin-like serine peptidase n=1 Tax=Streptomyces winkii TaxID=3051178 RepID=UPI0028D1E8BF|nr:hypothetical protein [Streptomyces sp. DSM 40971]